MTSVQYRVIVGKKDELVDGPDDADLVVTVPARRRSARDDFDATVAYMRGKLKSTGPTGRAVRAVEVRRGRRGTQPDRCTSLSSL